MATPKKKSPQLPAKRTDKQKQEKVWRLLVDMDGEESGHLLSEVMREIMAIFDYEVEQ